MSHFYYFEVADASSLRVSRRTTDGHHVGSAVTATATKDFRRALVLYWYSDHHAGHIDGGIHAFVGAHRRTTRAPFTTRRGPRNRIFRLAADFSGPEQFRCGPARSASPKARPRFSSRPGVDDPFGLSNDRRDGAPRLRSERRP